MSFELSVSSGRHPLKETLVFSNGTINTTVILRVDAMVDPGSLFAYYITSYGHCIARRQGSVFY